MYDLTSLVKVRKVMGVSSFWLETKFGSEFLANAEPVIGRDTRTAYKIAMRTLRLRQQGFDETTARNYAKEAQVNASIGKLAIMHMQAEDESMDFFTYLVNVKLAAKVA